MSKFNITPMPQYMLGATISKCLKNCVTLVMNIEFLPDFRRGDKFIIIETSQIVKLDFIIAAKNNEQWASVEFITMEHDDFIDIRQQGKDDKPITLVWLGRTLLCGSDIAAGSITKVEPIPAYDPEEEYLGYQNLKEKVRRYREYLKEDSNLYIRNQCIEKGLVAGSNLLKFNQIFGEE